eukprot:CAMPEP_0172636880 /NCGR_PEP_ID=MMETSP1068-20121228/206088_1 /TAXON_ID=35684 /ORGANISM="Pseudopedinella elastica, Strain CCMP716" /LENGTH=154 /DNA_ID=CAMNT_0013449403 /DNA_START=99 /DNA_END=563 /DNA_ORIENTATION=+
MATKDAQSSEAGWKSRFSRTVDQFLELLNKGRKTSAIGFQGAASLQRISSAVQLTKRPPQAILTNIGDWTEGKYTGELDVQGRPHGNGIKVYTQGGGPFNYEAGFSYSGEWKDGLYHGRGTLLKKDGTVRACGIWRHGKFSKVDWTGVRVQPVD